jgi:uncharacterized oligopeptide transporter (OPT) family protein
MEGFLTLIYVFCLSLNVYIGIETGFTFLCIVSTILMSVCLLLSIVKLIKNI